MPARLDEHTQFVDEGGRPIVNGYIYIGAKDQNPTLNLLPIYADRALTIPLANPQRTDASGRSLNKMWFNGEYAIKIEDANNVQKLIDTDAGVPLVGSPGMPAPFIQGVDIASESSLMLGTDGNMFNVTGTTDINAISTEPAGTVIYLRFIGAGLNVVHTPSGIVTKWGFNYRTVPNEIIGFLWVNDVWQMLSTSGPPDVIGMIVPSGLATAHAGYLLCDGLEVDGAIYTGLFAAVGTTFGPGSGGDTFNLPDLRGRYPLGADNMGGTPAGQVTSPEASTLGGTLGYENHILTTPESPPHAHTVQASNTPGGVADTVTSGDSTSFTVTVSTVGGGQAHNNMPPYQTCHYMIRF